MKYNRENKTIEISQNTGISLSMALLIMFAGAIFTVAAWSTDTRSEITYTKALAEGNRSAIDRLKAQNNSAEVRFTEIQTQLKGIDTTLLEIKQKLR